MEHIQVLTWSSSNSKKGGFGHAGMFVPGTLNSDKRYERNSHGGNTYISFAFADYGDEGYEHLNAPRGPRHPISHLRRKPGASPNFIEETRTYGRMAPHARLNAGQAQPREGQFHVGGHKSRAFQMDGEVYDPFSGLSPGTIDIERTNALGQEWRQYPQNVVGLPVENRINSQCGLNAHAMKVWWEAFRHAHADLKHFFPGNTQGKSKDRGKKYGYVAGSSKYNCASIVMRALIAGQADFFHKAPKPLSAGTISFYTPVQVLQYARDLKIKIAGQQQLYLRHLNEKLKWQGGKRQELLLSSAECKDLLQVTEWEQLSNKNIKWGLFRGAQAARFARRKGQTLRIDQLLREYHRCPDWTQNAGADKLRCMVLIWHEIASYFAAKPRGDRTEAMIYLGQQVMKVREYHARGSILPWFDEQMDYQPLEGSAAYLPVRTPLVSEGSRNVSYGTMRTRNDSIDNLRADSNDSLRADSNNNLSAASNDSLLSHTSGVDN